ncbi:hypothetical protein HY630_01205 [Candidatus Uhrbacteria bacterium]|nr:hypothetical protein [Candidatus Uhrbacteria bacterium]
MTREEAEREVLKNEVFCQDETCGDPIVQPFGGETPPRQRRRMNHRGSHSIAVGWHIERVYTFACPVCGKARRFQVKLAYNGWLTDYTNDWVIEEQ